MESHTELPDPAGVPPIRAARTCYDHLAGIAGVTLCAGLVARGWITPVVTDSGKHQPGYALTAAGRAALAARGVAIPQERPSGRRFAYACPDWTERQPHLAGALGAAVLRRLEEVGVVECDTAGREVAITGDIAAWLA